MKPTLKVLFYLKKNEIRPDGTCPLMGRITIDKSMVQFSCKLLAPLDLWDTKSGRAMGKSSLALSLNRSIDKINVSINTHYTERCKLQTHVLASDVKNAFQASAYAQETLLSIFEKNNAEIKKSVGINISAKYVQNLELSKRYLLQFIQEKYKLSDISFKQLNRAFIEDYTQFLCIDKKLASRTIYSNIIPMRKAVKTAICKGIIRRDPFMGYTYEKRKSSVHYIPKEELESLMNTTFSQINQNFVRDIFVFSCFCGLSYIDIKNLTFDRIVCDGGIWWIKTKRQKTGTTTDVRLFDIALQIIEKYKGLGTADKVFPMISNVAVNKQLKKMAKICKIERRLSFHMARHTFASVTCLSQGVPMETLSRMLGHSNLQTTQIYAKITYEKISKDIDLLAEKIADKYARFK